MKYRFTVKQLYGYSIMNWQLFQNKVIKADNQRYCSFCQDCTSRCRNCQIAKYICNMRIPYVPSIYKEIINAKENFLSSTDSIIRNLTNKYYEVDT